MKRFFLSTYTTIINTGTSKCTNDFEKRRVRVVNIFLFASIWVVLSFGVMNVVLNLPILVFLDLLLAFLLSLGFLLNRFVKRNINKVLILILLPLYFMIFPLFFGNIGTEYYNFVFLIIGFYIIDKKPHLILLSIFITSLFIYSKYLINTVDYPDVYDVLEKVHYYPSVIASVIIIASSIAIFKFDTEKFQIQILRDQAELSRQVFALNEKEVLNKSLLNELNHRVKNNLQLVSGLFTLQSFQTKNKHVLEALKDAQNRLDTIMILHQHLYSSKQDIEPDMHVFIHELTHYIKTGLDINEAVELELDIPSFQLPTKIAVHIGLIINELFTNALKYGVDVDKGSNRVSVSLQESDTCIEISVRDTGMGFPKSFELKDSDSFGMELILTLLKQYNGEIVIDNQKGAIVKVKLYKTYLPEFRD